MTTKTPYLWNLPEKERHRLILAPLAYIKPYKTKSIKSLHAYCKRITKPFDVRCIFSTTFDPTGDAYYVRYPQYPKLNQLVIKQPLAYPNLWFIIAFCHEFAHVLQHKFYKNPKNSVPGYGKSLKTHLMYEREAEKLSYKIQKQLFPDYTIQRSYFSTYKTKYSINRMKQQLNLIDDLD